MTLVPCKIITLSIHHNGVLRATMGWAGWSADQDLTLARGSRVIATSYGLRSTESLSSNVTGDATHELVTYYSGANIVTYELRVKRPN